LRLGVGRMLGGSATVASMSVKHTSLEVYAQLAFVL
jgi:hypothetical protein